VCRKVMGFIYMVRNMINARPYIGQTVQKDVVKRWKAHKGSSIGPYFRNALMKYGREKFSYSILCECPDDKLNEYETSYIKLYSSMCPSLGGIGYNLTLGGGGGRLAPESRRKISTARLGFRHSEQSKKKMSESRKGVRLSASHRKRLSVAALRRLPASEQTRKKMSASQKAAGKTCSEKHKQLLRDLKSKKVSQFTLEGVFNKTFDSVLEASLETGVNYSAISKCALGHHTRAGPFIWRYLNGQSVSIIEKAPKPKNRSKKVSQFTLEGVFMKTFDSALEASIETDVNHSGICKCAGGKSKRAGPFIWKYEST